MKKTLTMLSAIIVLIILTACPNLFGPNDDVIDIVAITGVTSPAYDETPVTAVTESVQYSGTLSWSPSNSPFAAEPFIRQRSC